MPPVVFVFLDGMGLGPPDDSNPFWKAPMKALRKILGGPLVAGAEQDHPGLHLSALDALLGIEGIPQSATGQTSLFTGINAVQRVGYHLPAFPNDLLREIVQEHSILRRATEKGYQATFANAYSPLYFEMVKRTNRRMSATTHAVLGANLPFRWISDLEKGKAIYWDITNEQLAKRYNIDIPIITPEQAGRNLAGISRTHDLVLYESFLTDVIGHKKQVDQALDILDRLDRFLGSLWDTVSPRTTVVVCSDHGNIENINRGNHTTNPVPLLVKGPEASAFCQARAITDVAGPILHVLERENDDISRFMSF